MHKLGAGLLVTALALGTTACQDFLDVNTNPNAPQDVTPSLYLPPMIHWVVTAEQIDARFLNRYTQAWLMPQSVGTTTPNQWTLHGYEAGQDYPAEIYRDVYWNLGMNLTNMISRSEAEERWDALGVGYILRAWGWLMATDEHGEIIVKEAFTPDQYTFNFDTQEYAYQEVLSLLDKAIASLQRTDGKVNAAYLAVGDKLFNGDRTMWLKYAWGLKAKALNHFSNKTTYKPAEVIAAVDKSFGPGEDALFRYPNTSTDNSDRNYFGTTRAVLGSYRQTTFMVGLMNGTAYPGAVDPRITRMLAQDSTGTVRGLDIMVGYGSVIRERPWNFWGYYGTGSVPAGQSGRFLFDDRAKFPIMTYAQLQFIKAEAALKMGDQAMAKQAYLNGIGSHIDFVNARTAEVGNPAVTAISNTEKAAFLANPEIAPATITLSHIMGQKFIAQWPWSSVEAWMDMRRYHYTDMDPVSGTQVFRNFNLPTQYYIDNNGKPVQRARPRYNSDYVWNRAGLDKIGGLALDYHTKPMWITEK